MPLNHTDALILMAMVDGRATVDTGRTWRPWQIQQRLDELGRGPCPSQETIGRRCKLMAQDPHRPPAARLLERRRLPPDRRVVYSLTAAGWRDAPSIIAELLP